jgi:hypothetical protein
MMNIRTTSQHQKALASLVMLGTHGTFRMLIQSTGIEMKECLGATAAFLTEIRFPKQLGRCAKTT